MPSVANCITWLVLLLTMNSLALANEAQSNATQGPVQFNQQIRPILSKHCIACHGPDEGDRQADLRLDTLAGASADMGGYAAIQPGEADQSEMIARIVTEDVDLRMPPADHAAALDPQEIDLLKQWINEGANYEVHWSFIPPISSTVPEIEHGLAHNEIDAFILQRVYEAGLKQNQPAHPRTLIRRLSLDLTGLPPVAHDEAIKQSIADYLADPRQDRFEAVVDLLLRTQAYAEHWAAMWLDLARYADTVGYSGDERRDIWPWRDWLIRALLENKSYKQMSIEMLAGDLLPDASDEQRLATAFHRNTLSNNEGGTNDEEFRVIAIKDRLSTTINAWMGLTVRCAECHSHKYDPLSQQEYYQLLDFFNQTVDSDKTDERPKLAVYPELDTAVTAKIEQQIGELEAKLAKQPAVWSARRPEQMTSLNGTKLVMQADDSILATGPNPEREEYAFTFTLPAGESVQAIRLEALPHVEHDGNVGRGGEGAFILSQIRLVRHDGEKQTKLRFANATNDFNQVNQHAKTAIREDVKSGARKQGWAVNHPVSGYKAHHEAIFQLQEPLVAGENTSFTVHLRFDSPWVRLNMGCVRIATCSVSDAVKNYDNKQLDPLRREIRQLMVKRDAPVRVPVLEELPGNRQRKMHVMLRGNFQSPGEQVSAEFPRSFAFVDADTPRDRLGLARWLFVEQNPLTARVAVNRYWSRMMGIGLVETEEDFGTQGTPPSHPELLDFLAVTFRDNGWDVQSLLKRIVMSATYQQSASATQDSIEQDPRNRLLSRGPRIRLSAEVMRDQALSVSGLLSSKSFGPPVYPPSPIKRVTNAFTGGMTWQESTGADRFRRAIYTFFKRSAPHPLFETFDMSSRDVCSMRRLRTNTPLQSFMTLNDITFIEAARALADKMIASSDTTTASDPDAQLASSIASGLESALYVESGNVTASNMVTASNRTQQKVLKKLYHSSAVKYMADLQAAAELIGENSTSFEPGELTDSDRDRLVHRAAMTVVANVILNLDGFLNN